MVACLLFGARPNRWKERFLARGLHPFSEGGNLEGVGSFLARLPTNHQIKESKSFASQKAFKSKTTFVPFWTLYWICTCSKLGTIGWSAVFLCMALFEILIGFSMPIILFASSLATALKAGDVALRWFVRRRQARAGVSLKPVERFLDGTKVRGHRLTLTRPTQGATGISFLTRGRESKIQGKLTHLGWSTLSF